jgi:hypothetical protein
MKKYSSELSLSIFTLIREIVETVPVNESYREMAPKKDIVKKIDEAPNTAVEIVSPRITVQPQELQEANAEASELIQSLLPMFGANGVAPTIHITINQEVKAPVTESRILIESPMQVSGESHIITEVAKEREILTEKEVIKEVIKEVSKEVIVERQENPIQTPSSLIKKSRELEELEALALVPKINIPYHDKDDYPLGQIAKEGEVLAIEPTFIDEDDDQEEKKKFKSFSLTKKDDAKAPKGKGKKEPEPSNNGIVELNTFEPFMAMAPVNDIFDMSKNPADLDDLLADFDPEQYLASNSGQAVSMEDIAIESNGDASTDSEAVEYDLTKKDTGPRTQREILNMLRELSVLRD